MSHTFATLVVPPKPSAFFTGFYDTHLHVQTSAFQRQDETWSLFFSSRKPPASSPGSTPPSTSSSSHRVPKSTVSPPKHPKRKTIHPKARASLCNTPLPLTYRCVLAGQDSGSIFTRLACLSTYSSESWVDMDLEKGLGVGKKKVLLVYLLLPFVFHFVRVVSDACPLLDPTPGGSGFLVWRAAGGRGLGRYTDFVFRLGFLDGGGEGVYMVV